MTNGAKKNGGCKDASTSSVSKNDDAIIETQPNQKPEEVPKVESQISDKGEKEEEIRENQEEETDEEVDILRVSEDDEMDSATALKRLIAKEGKGEEVEENQEEESEAASSDSSTETESSSSENQDDEVEESTEESDRHASQDDEMKDASSSQSSSREEGEIKEKVKDNQAEETEEEASNDNSTEMESDRNVSQDDEMKDASSSQSSSREDGEIKENKGEESEEDRNVNDVSSSQPQSDPRESDPVPRAPMRTQEAQPEYFMEQRGLEDLWKAVFPVGNEWEQLDDLYEIKWNFTNLVEALDEGGKLFGKRIFVFGCTETYENENKPVIVPIVVCVDSSIPPCDEIEVSSVESPVQRIIPMKEMKRGWRSYIPLEKSEKPVDRMNSKIFILACKERRYALKYLSDDPLKKFKCFLPYIYNPYREDEYEQRTVIQITFPSEPQVVCEYDWAKDNLEEFTDDLIKQESSLAADRKDEFKEFVKEQSDLAKQAYEEVRQVREKAKEEMSEETKKAYQEMKLYKFYPLPSPDTPDISLMDKSPFINRHFGNADEVL